MEFSDGDPGVSRTRDLEFRKLLLYPSELRGHGFQYIQPLAHAKNLCDICAT